MDCIRRCAWMCPMFCLPSRPYPLGLLGGHKNKKTQLSLFSQVLPAFLPPPGRNLAYSTFSPYKSPGGLPALLPPACFPVRSPIDEPFNPHTPLFSSRRRLHPATLTTPPPPSLFPGFPAIILRPFVQDRSKRSRRPAERLRFSLFFFLSPEGIEVRRRLCKMNSSLDLFLYGRRRRY